MQFVSRREPGGQFRAVGNDHQNSLPPLAQFQQQSGNYVGRSLIEVARRFIAEQQKRLADQGSRQRHTLLLAS